VILWQGLRFVLDTIRRAAESELEDAPRLREQLLAAQLEFEAGALSAEELAEIETAILARLRALDAERDRKPIGMAQVQIDMSDVPTPTSSKKRKRRSRRGAG